MARGGAAVTWGATPFVAPLTDRVIRRRFRSHQHGHRRGAAPRRASSRQPPAACRQRSRRGHVVLRFALAAAVLLNPGLVASTNAQPRPRVYLSLREVSAASLSCALDVASNSMVGEAILSCQRTSPASHLGAHRPLTATEAARLFALAEQMQMHPQQPGTESAARPVGPQATLVVRRGAEGVTVDVSQGAAGLSDAERDLWRMLRAIADELRGLKR